ncbi:MAG: saccharopine dehydrogenase NADP-binding domain-containing protein [Chromatiales bacterium]|nr:saccharopine dehydrogenase NADP-binding domain-containing protein [Chromatiales bacterium]MDH3931909.1 saccharopine dehydrogenase NADP-binding domain-containing protein [Chromatiales bacterium]MDH4014987.1 saccharopine dehydrogenase NADP-binding domain-containing protein [Chromatiales bacterium]
MKKVVSVSLGPSSKDHEFTTRFLGHDFQVSRLGADGDSGKAWEMLRRHQADADAIGLGMIQDHFDIGSRRHVHKETERLLNVVTRVPATTGASLRRLLQVRAVRHVQKQLGHYFNNNIVLFLNGMVNYDMAQAMSDYTPNLKFADAVLDTGAPVVLSSLEQLELYARGSQLAGSVLPTSVIPTKKLAKLPGLTALRKEILAREMAKCHVIVGTFDDIANFGTPENLDGKTLITSAIDEDRMDFFTDCNVNLVVDVSPKLFDTVVGLSTIEAMILAALDTSSEELGDHDLEEIIEELKIEPRLLHPTGEFRNIRRFAFVIHPLSQEYIRKGFPLPKATPRLVMNQVEKAAAHLPPMVYCKMDNIISPTGAEAEGWLILVGGTPKEMLTRSPEFTYRRLLAAAKMAEKMGAQILGLGAFTKVVGDAGITVARRATIPVTTGNSYSASGALWAAADAMRRMNLVHVRKNGKVAAKTMVIGASGSIGSVSARLLAMAFDEVYLAARNQKKLDALKASILKETPDAKVVATTDYEQYLGDMDMIVTSTSGAGKKILDITKVKPGCVITDVARPLDLPPDEVAKRPDVLVIESGEIELPSDVEMKDIGLPHNVIYACLAETIVLALEGRFEVFTIGRDTEWQKVKEIYKMGLKHGMKLAAISGVNGVYSDDDIANVVRLAKQTRNNWKPGQTTSQATAEKAAAADKPKRKATTKRKPVKKVASRKKPVRKATAKKKPAAAKKKASAKTKRAPAMKKPASKAASKKKPVRKVTAKKKLAAARKKAAATTKRAAASKRPAKKAASKKKPVRKRSAKKKSASSRRVGAKKRAGASR